MSNPDTIGNVDWPQEVERLNRHNNALRAEIERLSASLQQLPETDHKPEIFFHGRDEIQDAINVILTLWDRRNARLILALEQLDKAAAEIERLNATLAKVPS